MRFLIKSHEMLRQATFGEVILNWLVVLVLSVTITQENETLMTSGLCSFTIGGHYYNLKSLARLDGKPRFVAEKQGWNYAYNPCAPFTFEPPCVNVAACLWDTYEQSISILGLQSDVKYQSSKGIPELVYSIPKSQHWFTTVNLKCNSSRKGVDDGIMTIIDDTSSPVTTENTTTITTTNTTISTTTTATNITTTNTAIIIFIILMTNNSTTSISTTTTTATNVDTTTIIIFIILMTNNSTKIPFTISCSNRSKMRSYLTFRFFKSNTIAAVLMLALIMMPILPRLLTEKNEKSYSVVGEVIGGVAGLILIVAGIIFYRKRRRTGNLGDQPLIDAGRYGALGHRDPGVVVPDPEGDIQGPEGEDQDPDVVAPNPDVVVPDPEGDAQGPDAVVPDPEGDAQGPAGENPDPDVVAPNPVEASDHGSGSSVLANMNRRGESPHLADFVPNIPDTGLAYPIEVESSLEEQCCEEESSSSPKEPVEHSL